jgi:hypothetical protein
MSYDTDTLRAPAAEGETRVIAEGLGLAPRYFPCAKSQ